MQQFFLLIQLLNDYKTLETDLGKDVIFVNR
jgi:hypothetical protein